MSLITQQDSIDLSQFVAPVDAFAAYVGGHWPNFSLACQRWPKARRKAVCVNAEENGDILDVEFGDALPEQYPGWHRRQVARGVKLPGGYANGSTMPAVLDAAAGAKIAPGAFVTWEATDNHVAEIPAGRQAAQYTFAGFGRDLDLSVCELAFWGESVPAINPAHYDWFDDVTRTEYGRKYDEEMLVRKYDHLRVHGKLNTLALRPVRRDLLVVANRVEAVALSKGTDGKPNWRPDHLGWRRQQLIHRVQGQRFV
jgi:hypothetical protein